MYEFFNKRIKRIINCRRISLWRVSFQAAAKSLSLNIYMTTLQVESECRFFSVFTKEQFTEMSKNSKDDDFFRSMETVTMVNCHAADQQPHYRINQCTAAVLFHFLNS
ncbi:MAG: hypothetical protein LBH60_02485 [Prevotellaceae bacterium]|nr:hypothetical protein [Prevotellaceae bacterium]